jgi:hypothetical protein
VPGLDVSFGGIRREVRELAALLISESHRRGYRFRDGECWGAVCRPVRGTEDSPNPTPSNHSWGLALDFNSRTNYLGRTTPAVEGAVIGDIPPWMPKLWADYGWRWGGNYSGRKDPMHFEFVGTPRAARRLTRKARKAFGLVVVEVEGKRFDRLRDALSAIKALLLASRPGTRIDVRTRYGGPGVRDA